MECTPSHPLAACAQAAEGQQLQQDVLTPVVIVYLMSYEHMGNGGECCCGRSPTAWRGRRRRLRAAECAMGWCAEVTCVSGCECKPMRLEGHQKVYQWSQNALASVDVSPAEHCRMQARATGGASRARRALGRGWAWKDGAGACGGACATPTQPTTLAARWGLHIARVLVRRAAAVYAGHNPG